MCLCFGIISCSSTKEVSQEQVNAAFEEVYDEFAKILILDGAKNYTVESGDNLSSIAKRMYGDDKGYYFPVIMLASSATILDPDLIQPGMQLTIPDLNKNLANPVAKEKLKDYFKEIASVYKKKGNATVQGALLDISKSL